MIVYRLACGQGHFFEGWFASSEACDHQAAAGQLLCPACSSAEVRKVPAAPYVKGSAQPEPASGPAERSRLHAQAVKALRTYILANTDDVGREFAEVARRMHYEEEAARNIRGQVTPEEATELQEEGVPAFAISPEVIPSGEIH